MQNFAHRLWRFFLVLSVLGMINVVCADDVLLASNIANNIGNNSSPEEITVFGQQSSALVELKDDIEMRLETVPGATNLVEPGKESRLATLLDALNFQPGVVVQEFFGGIDQPRINIRGSGLQGNPVSRGILMRQDYLPLNQADGSFIVGLLEPRDSRFISVYRGANSRTPGSITLGGDMNFISLTGEDEVARARFEAGSFGRQAMQLAYGGQGGYSDFRINLSSDKAEGYRHHSESERQSIRSNVGLVITPRVINRTYLSHTTLQFDMPFVLTEALAESDPESVFGDGDSIFDFAMNIYKRDPHRSTESLRFANRTQFVGNDSEQVLGLYWQKTDDRFVDPLTHTETQSKTYGAQWLWDYTDFRGRTRDVQWQVGLDWNRSDMPRQFSANHPFKGYALKKYGDFLLEAENKAISVLLDLPANDEWNIVAQLQWGESERYANDLLSEQLNKQQWRYFLPKAGLIYRPSEQQRWFMNISASEELPTFWELIKVNVNPIIPNLSTTDIIELKTQKAETIEVGGNGGWGEALLWDLAIYRSKVRNELLSTANQLGILAETSNYSGATLHQGIELGLRGKSEGQGGTLDYRLSWTHSDFRFIDGEFSGNQIAGVPKNLISAELLLGLGDLRFGPNIRWVLEANPMDHSNSIDQDGYQIFGFRVEYQVTDEVSTFLMADNITDKNYVSSFVVRAESNSQLPTVLPGNGFSLNAGFRIAFH